MEVKSCVGGLLDFFCSTVRMKNVGLRLGLGLVYIDNYLK